MVRTFALACLAVCVSAAPARTGASACAPTLPNELASTGSATQLVTVVAPTASSTRGALQLWRKAGACWLPAGRPWPAWLGQRGVSANRHEGDRTSVV